MSGYVDDYFQTLHEFQVAIDVNIPSCQGSYRVSGPMVQSKAEVLENT